MADIVFLGAGRVGGLALRLFLRDLGNMGRFNVLVLDKVDRNKLAEEHGIEFRKVANIEDILENIKGAQLVVTALPSRIAFDIIKKILERGYNVVDVSFIPEDPYMVEDIVKNKKVFYIVDAGFAPGYSNLVAGNFYEKLDRNIDSLIIRVGGIPVEPVPPIGYIVTWNPFDLIEEYTRSARIIENGAIKQVDPLSKIHSVKIPELGEYEGFYSDGLRTLLKNINAKNMAEITIRHKQHLYIMRKLRDLGFFDDKPLRINDVSILPQIFTARIFEEKLSIDERDIAIMEVIAKNKDNVYRHLSYLYGGIDKPFATSMYTALVFAKTIDIALHKQLDPGILPLEKLWMFKEEYDSFLKKYLVLKEIIT
ncbi:MAG: saccharopine dehydrogenase NADP-binding domain-containing protein [Staphylothermus sp.]|nr:saccharopine dehydrogenase NADP-binding domain-containing protein [Staphylothermus sp.]